MKQEELNEVLRLHVIWLSDLPGGQQANLSGADLRGANLNGTNLSEADLQGADLRGAILNGTDLRWAGLKDADLRRAELRRANLSRADLNGVNLSETKIVNTYFCGANLHGAKLPQGCAFYADLPRHNIIILHDIAYIDCHSLPLTEWLKRGPKIGKRHGYTADQIDLYMEILRRAHEARRTE
jgi:hypothetical protein